MIDFLFRTFAVFTMLRERSCQSLSLRNSDQNAVSLQSSSGRTKASPVVHHFPRDWPSAVNSSDTVTRRVFPACSARRTSVSSLAETGRVEPSRNSEEFSLFCAAVDR